MRSITNTPGKLLRMHSPLCYLGYILLIQIRAALALGWQL